MFARSGRADREGPYATCHCICLSAERSRLYFWRDQTTGALTRRSEWFVTKSPACASARPDRLHGFVHAAAVLRSAAGRAQQAGALPGHPDWMAKLDTIVHELYHIDPDQPGIRRIERADGTPSTKCHSPGFFEDVVEMVTQYLTSNPDPEYPRVPSLRLRGPDSHGMAESSGRRSNPIRRIRAATSKSSQPQPDAPSYDCPVEPLELPRVATHFYRGRSGDAEILG